MKRPNPELIDVENPEWTEEDFAKAVPFTDLPVELQNLLSIHIKEREEGNSRIIRQPAA